MSRLRSPLVAPILRTPSSMPAPASGGFRANQTNHIMKKIVIIAISAACAVATAYAGMKCWQCKGTGWNKDLKCLTCGGDGEIGN